jgi:hypothetical protein
MEDHFSTMRRASSQSWTHRMRVRGAGTVIFRPSVAANQVRWHIVEKPDGTRARMQFHPGIDVWRTVDGKRLNAEDAGDLGLRYIEPCEPEPARSSVGHVRR